MLISDGLCGVSALIIFKKSTFSNSGINKVATVRNALLPMSLYSLLWVNEIIRYHLHIVDRSTMCK